MLVWKLRNAMMLQIFAIFIPFAYGVQLGFLYHGFAHNTALTFETTMGVVPLALDSLVNDGILTPDERNSFHLVWRVGDLATTTVIMSKEGNDMAFDVVANESIDVLFGPPSSPGVQSANFVSQIYKVPHICWSAGEPYLDDDFAFPYLVRIQPSMLEQLGLFVRTMMKTFGWSRIGLISLYGALYTDCTPFSDTLINSLAGNITWHADFQPAEFNQPFVESLLNEMSQKARIIFLCTSTDQLNVILLTAHKKGMLQSGEYLFWISDPNLYDDVHPWIKNDSDDALRAQAWKSVFEVTVNNVSSSNFLSIGTRAIQRIRQPPFSVLNTTVFEPSSSAAYLYDAVYVYGVYWKEAILAKMNPKDDAYLFRKIRSRTFRGGASGDIRFNDGGGRESIYWIRQPSSALSQLEVIMKVDLMAPVDQIMKTVKPVRWNTPGNMPPRDTPACGFANELCRQNIIPILAGSAAALVTLLITGVATASIYKKRKFNDRLQRMMWKISADEIKTRPSVSLGSFASVVSTVDRMQMTTPSNSRRESDVNTGRYCTSVATCRGHVVFVKKIPLRDTFKQEHIVLLQQMRELAHPNINPFIGICADQQSPCILFEHCSKGSLQDILFNDDFSLEWMFKYSFMVDLVKGLHYIHRSPLRACSVLKSSNCVVDSRWVLKITDYGMLQWRPKIAEDAADHHWKDLFWTAPELLRSSGTFPVAGTPQGDIFSCGILFYEITLRIAPYSLNDASSAKDIIKRVITCESTPYRPFVSAVDASGTMISDKILKIIRSCWNENPQSRPETRQVLLSLREFADGRRTNIMDNMLEMMEKYASNLEGLVRDRTSQLIDEKKKTEQLLYRMLPRSVADQLKVGYLVEPEYYEVATVLFSDIIGFTTLAAQMSPLEVIHLLNDLYSLFDDIIEQHDVYKVRIGVHTGSCVAGVVGSVMPRYCLFGDTVNTASRMESSGKGLCIQLSESSFVALTAIGSYSMKYRGEIPIKGKGMQRTYWLLGRENYTKSLPNMEELIQQASTQWEEARTGSSTPETPVDVQLQQGDLTDSMRVEHF